MAIFMWNQQREGKKDAMGSQFTALIMLITFMSQCPIKESLLLQSNIFRISQQAPSEVPSLNPSLHPSLNPTSQPSVSLSNNPSSMPSITPTRLHSFSPSQSPSLLPSNYPSYIPSLEPSIQPFTSSPIAFYPLGYVPDVDDPLSKGYFNYNQNDINYGPGKPHQNLYYYNKTQVETIDVEKELMVISNNTILKNYTFIEYKQNAWSNIKDSYEKQYWESFNMNRTLGNRCDSSHPQRTQSPIDLCESQTNTKCHEHHQIRNRAGEYNLNDAEVKLKLLPSKLRIEYSQINSQLDKDLGLLPPHSDFPLNWNGYISAVHIDIKIPSEHTICGRRYAGEYQIYFFHPKRKMPIVQSVLIEIHPKGRPHKHFQKLLNEFQAIFDLQHLECQHYERKLMQATHKRLLRKTNDNDRNMDETDSIIDSFEEFLRWARNRTAAPTFDPVYDGLLQGFYEMKNKTELIQNRCKKDANVTFVIGNLTHSCCDIVSSNMELCQQDQLVQDCPNTCGLIINNQTNVNNTIDDNNNRYYEDTLESFIPSSAPTEAPRPIWNPFWPRIINSIHFYGYSGSLTEPPCSEWVAWRVLDTPMQISQEQWDQMRNILFNQVDSQCKRRSVHWNGSVARPTQSLNGRSIWKCTEKDYVSDVEKRMGSVSDDDVENM